MKTLKEGGWVLVVAVLFAGCAPQAEQAESEDQAAAAAEGAVAEGAEAAAARAEEAMAGEPEREMAPATPVVVYFKAEPSDADLKWLRESGFVVEDVNGAVVSGHFEYNPPPEFKDDPRLDRVVPLQRPPGPN